MKKNASHPAIGGLQLSPLHHVKPSMRLHRLSGGGLRTLAVGFALIAAAGTAGCHRTHSAPTGSTNAPADGPTLLTPPATTMSSTGEAPNKAFRNWLKRTAITRIQVWAPYGAVMYLPDGSIQSYEATHAVYQFITQPAKWDTQYAAVIFINRATGHVWAGRPADYYIETDAGILGLNVWSDVRWCESLIPSAGPDETLESLVQKFEKDKLYIKLNNPPESSTDLRDVVDYEFFVAELGSSQPANPHVDSLRLKGHVLTLFLASNEYDFRTELTFDVNKRSILQAKDLPGHAGRPSRPLKSLPPADE